MGKPICIILAAFAAVAIALTVAPAANADRKWDHRNASPNCVTFAEFKAVDKGAPRRVAEKLTGLNMGKDHSIAGYPKCSGGYDRSSYAFFYFPKGNGDRLFRHRWSFAPKVETWYCDWEDGLAVGCTITPEDVS